jgi:hypothetical protein
MHFYPSFENSKQQLALKYTDYFIGSAYFYTPIYKKHLFEHKTGLFELKLLLYIFGLYLERSQSMKNLTEEDTVKI